jgi:hypothetical protein
VGGGEGRLLCSPEDLLNKNAFLKNNLPTASILIIDQRIGLF